MKLHRFYVEDIRSRLGKLELDHQLWIHDEKLLNQWLKVLRFKIGDQLVLFNDEEERLYRVKLIEDALSVLLEMVTEVTRRLPSKHVYLLWSLLKSDKNEWVIQKATELGVKDLVPIISKRSEKTGLNMERSRKIMIEAAEQCGRSDIPNLREPIGLAEAIEEYAHLPLYICEQTAEGNNKLPQENSEFGLLVGPEGGWSDPEKALFKDKKLPHIVLSGMTLRAETATVAALTIALAQ
jgi:16S rRNA (uracil1498-N3)-methyltransferase